MRQLQITASITNRESRVNEIYLHEIGKVDMINAEEEVILARKIKQGDQAALEKLTKTNLRFVVSVAKKYQHLGLPLGDLISEGNYGLVKAAMRFDETRGFKFISFAVWWIRQSMLYALAEHTRMVRLPMNHINLLTKMNRLASDLENKLERQPTDAELAELMQVDIGKIEDARKYSGRTLSYDAVFNPEDEYTLLDKLSLEEENVMDGLLQDSRRQEMSDLLDTLSPKERRVISLSFGFEGESPLLPPDIAKVMNLSRETVRQVKREALQKLRGQAELLKSRLFITV
jgi:RNA polymerase primary sigma factor